MQKKLTPQSELISNEDYLLLFRGSDIFCSNLDVNTRPVTLQPLHILLLAEFFTKQNIVSACRDFAQAETTKHLLGNITENIVLSRVAELYAQNILWEGDTNTIDESISAPELFTYEGDVKRPSGIYRAHKNLALKITGNGFVAQYGISNQSLLLNTKQVFTLLALNNANLIEESEKFKAPHMTSEEHWQTISAFIHAGIINKKKERVAAPLTASPVSQNEPAWQTLQAEPNKTPIYFVPHTENHYPLALGLIHTSIADYQEGVLLERYQLIPITYMSADELLAGPYRKFGAGIWLFSNYLWSEETNMALSKFIKQDSPRNLTIHGGPSTPDYPHACEQFFAEHNSVDLAVHAEGEIAITQILKALAVDERSTNFDLDKLKEIPGISYRNYYHGVSSVIHTEKRTRMQDPNIIPSPYMEGVFEHYGNDVEAAIIETNRGCPFGCTFCDWGSAINQKVRRFDMPRIKEEIEWIAKNKTKVLWIADANFGILDRDIEVADYIIAMKKQYGYPQEVVVNYTKNTTVKLVEIIKIFTEGGIISQGVISIQTMDTQTLEVIDRKNIKTSKYEELREIFSDLKLPLSTDLMLGLPGTTMQALKNDLQHYVDADVPVKAYPTQLLPNSPMADPEYMKKYDIKTYEDGFLKSTCSYTEQDLNDMKMLYKVFTMADGYGLLRYVIRFMQWEYQIQAIDFIHDFMSRITAQPTKYPRLSFAMRFFETDKSIPCGWQAFYGELKDYVMTHYSVTDDSGLDTVLKVNQAVMPDESQNYPITVNLCHDFITYFEHNQNTKAEQLLRLTELGTGTIEVSDPDGMVEIDDTYLQYDSHQFFWELSSDVSRIRSAFTI